MFKRKAIVTAILIIVFLFTAAGVYFIRQNYVVPIIMYHQVLPNPDQGYRLAVSTQTFNRQMRFLKKHNFNVLPLEDLIRLIKEKKEIPSRTVVITFDDGYRDNYIYAFPVLKKYGLPAAIFLIVNEVGRVNSLGVPDRVSWQEIREMYDSGVITFGSHALGPEPLINIHSEEELKSQIFNSKSKLEKETGKKINIFSYPEGLFNTQIKQLVIDAGYIGAVATNPGKHSSSGDVFALKRIRISENAANMFIFTLEVSGFYTFVKEYKKYRKDREYGRK